MSEVSEIIQVGELMFRIGKGVSLTAIKVFRTIYYAQWYGKTSFTRLHKMAGSHISYLEINTQDKATLKRVQNQILEKFKVLYSPLPDLNGSDGRSQIAFDADQVESLKAGINRYNAEKMSKLSEAKERYGNDTENYKKAKAEIEKQYPEVRSITSDDYVMSRLDYMGKETKEYKALERSAKESFGVKKTATETNINSKTIEEKVIQFNTAQNRVKYEELIKEGKAQRVSVAEWKTEYVPIAGQEVPFYHAQVSNTESIVLPPSAKLDERSAVVLYDRSYPLINAKSEQIGKISGKDITDKLAEMWSVKITGKTGEKITKEVVRKGAETVGKVASKATPVTTVISAAVDGTKKSIELSKGGKAR